MQQARAGLQRDLRTEGACPRCGDGRECCCLYGPDGEFLGRAVTPEEYFFRKFPGKTMEDFHKLVGMDYGEYSKGKGSAQKGDVSMSSDPIEDDDLGGEVDKGKGKGWNAGKGKGRRGQGKSGRKD